MAAGLLCVFIWFLNIILPEVKDTRRICAKLSDFWKRLEKYIRKKKGYLCFLESELWFRRNVKLVTEDE